MEVKSDIVIGDVFYLLYILEFGMYKIEVGGIGVVKGIKIFDLDINEVVFFYEDSMSMIYGLVKFFVVRVDYVLLNFDESYIVKVGIYRFVKK